MRLSGLVLKLTGLEAGDLLGFSPYNHLQDLQRRSKKRVNTENIWLMSEENRQTDRADSKATVMQITAQTLNHMGYSSRRPYWVPLLRAKNRKLMLQFLPYATTPLLQLINISNKRSWLFYKGQVKVFDARTLSLLKIQRGSQCSPGLLSSTAKYSLWQELTYRSRAGLWLVLKLRDTFSAFRVMSEQMEEGKELLPLPLLFSSFTICSLKAQVTDVSDLKLAETSVGSKSIN